MIRWFKNTAAQGFCLGGFRTWAVVGLVCLLTFVGTGLASPAIAASSDRPTAILDMSSVTLPSSGIMLGSIFGGLFAGSRPDNLGSVDGQLQPCPGSPNCVSSQTGLTDPQHSITPLSFSGSGEDAFAALTEIVKAQDNSTLVKEESGYLYAEFRTSLMGFVDDVEFVLSPDEKVIHVRSASRLGQSDLGLNRQRVEMLRTALDRAIATSEA